MITSAAPHKPSQRTLLAALFIAALLLRLLRAHYLAIISPDAIRYILQAQALTVHPIQALRDEVYHPLFSTCILTLHTVLHALHPSIADSLPDRLQWIHSAQSIAILAGALIAPLIYALARQFGARFWPALAAGLLWSLTTRTSAYGIEANSDTLALALFAGSMLFALSAIPFQHGKLSRRAAQQLAAAGLLAGLAYLTRPEGLAAPLLILLTLTLEWLRSRATLPTKTFLKAATILLIFTALPAVPYMLTIQGITHKKQITLGPQPASAAPPKQITPSALHIARWTLDETAKTLSYPCLAILIPGLIFQRHRLGRHRLLAILWLLLWLAIMAWLAKSAGYLSGRHTLPLQLLLFAWLAIALQGWQRFAQWLLLLLHRPNVALPALFATAIFLSIVLINIPQLFSPPLGNQDASIALAIPWIRTHLRDNVLIADRQLLAAYCSGHPFTRWLGAPQNPAIDTLPASSPLILGYLYEPGTDIPQSLGPYHPLATFQIPPDKTTRGETYILYTLPDAHLNNP